MVRFSLRSFLIAAALLPLLIGMAWRCGQLDVQSGEPMSVRVGDYQLYCWHRNVPNPPYLSLRRHILWAKETPGENEGPSWYHKIQFTKRHPWDGREWWPSGSEIIAEWPNEKVRQ